MKQIFLVLMTVFSIASFSGQESGRFLKNDWKENALKGKVKSIITKNYGGYSDYFDTVVDYYNEEGQKLETKKYHKGKIVAKMKYIYLEGYVDKYVIMEEVSGDSGFLLGTGIYVSAYDYILNDKKEIEGQIKLFGSTNPKDGWTKMIFRYDKNGNVIGRLEESSAIALAYFYRYDDNGNKIEELSFGIECIYGLGFEDYLKKWVKGNLVIKKGSEEEYSEFSKARYRYNNKGDIIEKTENIEGIKRTIYLYEYDEYGNWISKVAYQNNELVGRETRVIEYYK